MPRNVHFSASEIAKIWRLKAQNVSISDIAKQLKRSRSGIYEILSKDVNAVAKHRSGRPRITSKRQDRDILRAVSTQKMSVREITKSRAYPISRSTVHRRIQESKYYIYRKMRRTPMLKLHHKKARLLWAKKYMHWRDEWLNVFFSDEKKFNLDGPDGWSCYWHDLRREPREFFSRQQGGGSLMVWGAFCFNGTTDIAFLNGRQNSEDYQNVLKSNLLSIGSILGGENWKFQQDNASIHISHSTKTWFARNQVDVIDWPSISPDLNPMENLWGVLARDVYAHGRQFFNIQELKQQIERSWFSLQPQLLQTLVQSLPDRIFKIIQNNGAKIRM